MQNLRDSAALAAGNTLPQLCNYIAGQRMTPAVDRGNDLLDPNTLEVLQAQRECSEEQVEAALHAADSAYQSCEWENTPAAERADWLERLADTLSAPDIEARIAYADAITTGAVIGVTTGMARLAPFVYRAAAGFLRTGQLDRQVPGKVGDVDYLRRPWGPALLVSPWNGPTAIGSHKIASALAAGAPCIAKPSEWAPHSAIIMAEAIHNAGLPEAFDCRS